MYSYLPPHKGPLLVKAAALPCRRLLEQQVVDPRRLEPEAIVLVRVRRGLVARDRRPLKLPLAARLSAGANGRLALTKGARWQRSAGADQVSYVSPFFILHPFIPTVPTPHGRGRPPPHTHTHTHSVPLPGASLISDDVCKPNAESSSKQKRRSSVVL